MAASLRARLVVVFWLFCALAAGSLAAAVAAYLLPSPSRLQLPLGTAAAVGGGVAGLAWAWYHGDRFARWLLLAAFAPLVLALLFPLARWLALAPLNFWSQHAVQLALGITLPAVFLLLILRSQERRDYRRRITQLDQVDPMTGLVNDDVFSHRLRGPDRAPAALQLPERRGAGGLHQPAPSARGEFGRKAVLEVLLRLAGRLTSLVRDVDTVARIGEARYGVLIEGPVPPDRAAALGSAAGAPDHAVRTHADGSSPCAPKWPWRWCRRRVTT